MKRASVLVAVLTLSAVPIFSSYAAAQEIGPALDMNLMTGWAAGAAVQADLEKRVAAEKKKNGQAQAKPQLSATKGNALHLAYVTTPTLKKEALDGYVERISKQDPKAAKVVKEQFTKHDASKIYHRIIADTGLRDNDVADNLAAYTILNWMIATGAPEPPAANVRAARNQIATVLAKDGRFADPALRAKLGEELKLLFVTVHAGWQSAQREGNLEQYSEGVAKMFGQQSNTTLRSLKLTSAGFVKA